MFQGVLVTEPRAPRFLRYYGITSKSIAERKKEHEAKTVRYTAMA